MRCGPIDSLLRYGGLAGIVIFGVLLGLRGLDENEEHEARSQTISQNITNVCRLDPGIEPCPWKNIIVHHSGPVRKGIDFSRYHFVVGDDGLIRSTSLWKSQNGCRHTASPDLNANSISVCVLGDFSKGVPTEEQLQSLTALMSCLMEQFAIKKRYIWRASEVDDTDGPGDNFPWSRLLRVLPAQ